MFLGGLWHGAQWTFVVWGLYHGVLLGGYAVVDQVMRRRLPAVLSVAITFLSVHFGWVLFRSPDFERAGEIYRGLFGRTGIEALFEFIPVSGTFGSIPALVNIGGGPRVFPFLVLGLAIALFGPNSHELRRRFRPASALWIAVLLFLCIAQLGRETPFIYFQF